MQKTVVCKLWNQASDLEVDNGQNVVITNLLTKSWKDEIALSSTDLTNINVSLYVYCCKNVVILRKCYYATFGLSRCNFACLSQCVVS